MKKGITLNKNEAFDTLYKTKKKYLSNHLIRSALNVLNRPEHINKGIFHIINNMNDDENIINHIKNKYIIQ